MVKQLVLAGFVMIALNAAAVEPMQHPQTDVYEGWRLGVQSYSFRKFTFLEAVDKARSLGLGWVQAYPGQKIAPDSDVKMNWAMSEQTRQMVMKTLTDANVRMCAYGVVGVPKEETEARKLFEFAKAMGIEVIVSEPSADQFDLIDTLCQEYQIKLAVHNHPSPSRYWNPDAVLAVVKGRSQWIGACVDVGHWVRSGLDPVDCLKKLEGRIYDVHIKEIDKEAGHDVVWGTGQARIKGILEELHRQGYQGTFAIEYEHNWDNSVPEIRRSIAYFNSVASALKPSGWKDVFAGDLSNADFKPDSWVYQDGVLELKGGGDIWTQAAYGDFVFDFDFNVEDRTNSGVFIRTGDRQWIPWIEVQIADSYGKDVSRHICGAIFDVQAPRVNAMRPAGQWNRLTIRAKGPQINVVLNNEPIIEINLDDWTEAGKNPDGTDNKFRTIAYKDLPREGFIGFQDHRDGTKVSYRNIRIKEL